MIDLFALEYPNYIIKHTFNNVILLTDQKTGVVNRQQKVY